MSEQGETSFVFVGEALVLDLINTLVIIRGKQHDLLETPQDLAVWWAETCQHHPQMAEVRGDPPAYDAALMVSIKAFRDSLRRLFISVIQGQQPDKSEIQTLNEALQTGYPALQWQAGSAPKAIYGSQGNPHSALLLPIALSAQELLAHADLSRLHRCHNRRCILLFYDTTKSGTRQWCSTACFDRERSSQRYEQKKHSR